MINEKNKIIELFREASKTVPAYKKFLKQHHVDSKQVIRTKCIEDIPIMDKKNYLYRYHMEDFFNENRVKPIVYASSGSSGKPTFWFSGDEQEKVGAELHEFIFKNIFGIKKNEKTLVVVCFSMGIWVAGGFTLSSCKKIIEKGYNMTVVTPGIEKGDIFNSVKRLMPHYDNIIFAGYPPFLMDVIHEIRDKSISFRGKKIKMITAGDKFSEKWRDDMLRLIGSKDPYRTVISIYGSADATILGHETPLSIFIRRAALKDVNLRKEIFGKGIFKVPALMQYHSKYIIFEEKDEELIFSTKVGIILLRYNIHDLGKLLAFDDVLKLLRKSYKGSVIKKLLVNSGSLPFLFLKGRTDVAVTFYAINIFPEHIQSALDGSELRKYLTGSYTAFHQSTKNNKKQKLVIVVEAGPKVRISKKLKIRVQEVLTSELLKRNIEYRKLHSVLGKEAFPSVRIIKEGDRKLQYILTNGVLAKKGSKPKMII